MKVILAIIGFIFATLFAYNFYISSSPSVDVSKEHNNPIKQRTTALSDIRLVAAIKNDSEIYSSVQQAANSTSVDNIFNTVRGSLWWDVRRLVEQYADDEGQRLWAEAYLQQLREAQRAGKCPPFSFPIYERLEQQEIYDILSNETQQKTVDALTYIVENKAEEPIAVPDMSELTGEDNYWIPIVQQLRKKYGDDIDLINQGEVAKDRKRQCDVLISYLEVILSKKPSERAAALRYFLDRHIAVVIF